MYFHQTIQFLKRHLELKKKMVIKNGANVNLNYKWFIMFFLYKYNAYRI